MESIERLRRDRRAVPGRTWQEEMKRAFRSAEALCRHLGLPVELAAAGSAAADFPVFAPHPFVARMRRADPTDPLLRQVLPVAAEELPVAGYGDDPVADLAAQSLPGVIQKYEGRVLLIASGSCAIHCRYCFRRHFPYSAAPHSIAQWRSALASVGRDARIQEVILSGGDPLTLTDDQLGQLIDLLTELPSVRRLRLHTRLPVVIPQRVTQSLTSLLSRARFGWIVVLHINHAQEIDAAVTAAADQLRSAGAWLWNQAVLLRGVNDTLAAQRDLSESLVQRQIVPYYLHQLDQVSGAAHFEVPLEQGQQLVQQLKDCLPGYAVPRYVRDEPGHRSKRWLSG